MSIPYLPGWWDSIDKNALKGFMDGATKAFLPNQSAQFQFNEMVKKDPSLITKISDLDPTQREAFAKSLGFTNYEKSGLGNIGESFQLQTQRQVQDFLKNATPDQQQVRLSGLAGTKTQEEIDQGRTSFSLGKKEKEGSIRVNEQRAQLNDMELKERSEFQTLQETLKAKFPADQINLNQALSDMVAGKTNTPLMQRIISDPTIAPAFNNLFELYKQRVGMQAQMNIAALRSPQEKMFGLTFLQQGVDNAQAQINAAQQAIKNEGILGQMQQSPTYLQALQSLQAAKEEHSRFSAAFNRAMETEFKGKYPSAFDPATGGLSTTGPINPKIKAAAERIISGQATIAQLDASPSLSSEEKAAIRMLIAAQGGGNK